MWVFSGHLSMLLGRATMEFLVVVLNVEAFRMKVKAVGVEVPLNMSAAGNLTIKLLERGGAAGAPPVLRNVVAMALDFPVPTPVPSGKRSVAATTPAAPSWSSNTAP